MLNDLSVFTEPWRKKRPFGFTGDASRHADPDAYFLYFMDDGTWGREEWGGRPGFWLRGGASAEVVVRAFDIAPVERVVLRIRGGPRGDQVTARRGFRSDRVSVGPGDERELVLELDRGVRYYDTYLHVLHLSSRRGAALPDGRVVGAFVEIRLVTRPRLSRGGHTVRGRIAPLGLAVVSGLVLLLAAVVDLPRAADGRFWSDGATYHAMAGSLAFDRDLEFTAADLDRVKAAYPGGPQGVFLKRVHGPAGSSRLVYAKAAAYPALAAPLVRLVGTDRGLLLLNALAFLVALWLGYGELGHKDASSTAAAGTLALVGLGVVPVYLLWQTPELLNLALATAGLVAYRHDRPYLSAVLLGLAVYSKPTHLALALPLVLAPLVSAGAGWARRILEAARRGVVLDGGGGRGLRPRLAGHGRAQLPGRRAQDLLRPLPVRAGRDVRLRRRVDDDRPGGPAGGGAGRARAGGSRRSAARCRGAAALVPAQPRLLLGGPLWRGARLLPGTRRGCALVSAAGPARSGRLAGARRLGRGLDRHDPVDPRQLVRRWWDGRQPLPPRLPAARPADPAARARWAGCRPRRGRVGGIPDPGPAVADPSLTAARASTRRGRRSGCCRRSSRMLGDLSVFTDVWRKRRPYGGYFLWFLDDGSFGQETSFDAEGFWLRGGAGAEVVLQTPGRPERIRLKVTAGPAGDIVTARIGSARQRVVLPPLKSGEIVFEAPHPALGYYGTSLYLLKLGSRYGGTTETDLRTLGSFVVLEARAP